MSSTSEQEGDADGTPRVPPEFKARIRQAIAHHLREAGNANWDLVREHPDFAPYIGRASGEAGRRMYHRWKKELSSVLRRDRTRPKDGRAEIEAHQAWAKDEAAGASAEPGLPIRPTPAQLMAEGRGALRGYHLVAAQLRQASEDIARIRQCAIVADADGVGGFAASDPQLLTTAVKLQHENSQMLMGFLGGVTRLQHSEEFTQAVVGAIDSELADLPEHRDRLVAALDRALERYQGPRQ